MTFLLPMTASPTPPAIKARGIATRIAGIVLAAALPFAASAESQRQEAQFDLILLGLTAGTLEFTGTEDGGSYSVTGVLTSGGLVGMMRKVSYNASSSGTVADGTFRPDRYSENADTGTRQSKAVIDYPGGVPTVVSYDPPRKERKTDVDPATQGGSVDPLTALYATLRDVAPGQECKVSVAMFDGRRASRLSITAPRADGEKVICQGEYRRIAGFSKRDMEEKTAFPFTLTYAPTADGQMHVELVEMETLYGTARMVRR